MRTLMFTCSELVASPDPLPPAIQTNLVDLAMVSGRLSKSEREALLRLLLARPDLDPVLDARIGEERSARVRASWVARPGRSIDEIIAVLDGESRQSVLAEIAATEGLSDEVYDELVDRCSGPRALCTVITGPAPVSVKRVAALKLIALDDPQVPSKSGSTVGAVG